MQKRWCSLEWSANLFSGFTNFRNKSFWWKWWGAICIVISTKVKIQYLWTRTFVNISDLCWPLEQHKIKRWLICWKDLIVLKRQYKTKFCISQSVTPVKYSRKLLLILFCFCFLAKACQSERTGTAHTWLKCSHWYPTIWSLSSLPLFFHSFMDQDSRTDVSQCFYVNLEWIQCFEIWRTVFSPSSTKCRYFMLTCCTQERCK